MTDRTPPTRLQPVARDVWRLPLMPMDALNAYLVDDVVVDAGTVWSQTALLSALDGRDVRAHVLTHAHPDHQGASRFLCETRSIPLWCGANDRYAAETGVFSEPWSGQLQWPLFRVADTVGGPGQPVARTLEEGDAVADFVVVDTPGHTAGHLSLWREDDGTVILGDVASHRNPLSLSSRLREPSRLVTRDPRANRRSIAKIAALQPTLVCFGHGPPLDGASFVRWANDLAAKET